MVNYVAILVCGIASMVVGFIWYGPLFGKVQMQVMGADDCTPEQKEAMRKAMGGMYLLQFILALIMIWTIDMVLVHWAGQASAVKIAVFLWFGFVVTLAAGGALWSGKPKKMAYKMFLLSAGAQLVTFIVVALILSAWK